MTIQPPSPSPTTSPRCFICWDTLTNTSDYIKPCNCKNQDLKYVHKSCFTQWLNSSHIQEENISCKVCKSPYEYYDSVIPVKEVVARNFGLVVMFLLLMMFPVVVYGVAYWRGFLTRTVLGYWLFWVNLGIVGIAYVVLGVYTFNGMKRYRRTLGSEEERRLL